MSYVLLVIGVLIEAVVMVDVIRTTLSFAGMGPITFGVTRAAARALRWTRRHRHPMRASFGAIVALAGMLAWVALAWIGWCIVFRSGARAVLHESTGTAAGFWEIAYFSGFNLATLGIGDYVPNGAGWQLAAVVAAAQGFFLITLSVTYLLNVISSAALQHKVALVISNWGESATAVLASAYDPNGGDRPFRRLLQRVHDVIPDLADVDQRFAAYGVVHHFLARHATESLPVNAARLYEVWLLLRFGVHESQRPDDFALGPFERAMNHHLQVARDLPAAAVEDPPSIPSLDELRAAGVRCVEDAEFVDAVQRFQERRCRHLALVRVHGWGWSDVDGRG